MLTIQNEYLRLTVDPHGAQMMELGSKQGTQFLWNGDEKYWRDRAPVLFPYVARLTEGCYTLCGERYEHSRLRRCVGILRPGAERGHRDTGAARQ